MFFNATPSDIFPIISGITGCGEALSQSSIAESHGVHIGRNSATLQALEWCGRDSLKHTWGLPRPDDHLALGPEMNFRGEHTARLEEASGPEREVATQGLQTLPELLTEREEDRGLHARSH